MKYIIIFSTHWGYQEGGINSFNYDFCIALGNQCKDLPIKIICISFHDPNLQGFKDAENNNVKIISLNKKEGNFSFEEDIKTIKNELAYINSTGDHIFVGHDVFTGNVANFFRDENKNNAVSIVFHHMDYQSYYAIKGDVDYKELDKKLTNQKHVLSTADIVIGVGPKLRNSAKEKVKCRVEEIIPGMQEIEVWNAINKMQAITFGRYDLRTDRLKQMGLGIKAFARYVDINPTLAGKDPTLKVIGLEKETDAQEIKNVYNETVQSYINILPLPYKVDRNALFTDLSQSNLCMMLSVHDGFGLVGLEAIAAGVPLILSENTGLYEFLSKELKKENLVAFGVYNLRIKGSVGGDISDEDLKNVEIALIDIGKNKETYKKNILILRKKLKLKYTWEKAALSFLKLIKNIKKKQLKFETTNRKELPQSHGRLLGRQEEIKEIQLLYDSKQTNIVSITAWGGVGKTSLVKMWINNIKEIDNQKKIFVWSFYSQGSSDIMVSSDLFFLQALKFFNDYNPEFGTVSEKANRLASLLSLNKAVLILDGLEPIQYTEKPLIGYIKDYGLKVLIQQLVYSKDIFCLITSRISIRELEDVESIKIYNIILKNLSISDSVKLLKQFHLYGNEAQFFEAAKKYECHALSLVLLGNLIHELHAGDITFYENRLLLEEDKYLNNPAFRMMRRYDNWISLKELQFLKLFGFFNRPAKREELEILIATPEFIGLNDLINTSSKDELLRHENYLKKLSLIVNNSNNNLTILDSHPLIREYQQNKLKQNLDVWKEGNKRLFEYLVYQTEREPTTISGIIDLYIAIYHGCMAGLYTTSFEEVLRDRVWRGDSYYSTNILGIVNDELEVLNLFFEVPFKEPRKELSLENCASLFSQTAFCLRAALRLNESVEPHINALNLRVVKENWEDSIINSLNICQTFLYIGDIEKAQIYAEKAILYSTKLENKHPVWMTAPFTNLAIVFLEKGDKELANSYFIKAESILKIIEPDAKYLYSNRGYQKCEYLLSEIERSMLIFLDNYQEPKPEITTINLIYAIANYGLKKANDNKTLFLVGLYNLILAKIELLNYTLDRSSFRKNEIEHYLNESEKNLIAARVNIELPKIYIVRASYKRILSEYENNNSFLQEGYEHLKLAFKTINYGKLKLHQILYEIELMKNLRLEKKFDLFIEAHTRVSRIIDKHGFNRYRSEINSLYKSYVESSYFYSKRDNED